MLNNLDKIKAATNPLPYPTGSLEEVAVELIRRCDERDGRLETVALEAEREGDTDGTWMAMHIRSENKRARDRIESDLKNIRSTNQVMQKLREM